mmetsp:Transcript_245/g.838  ORF Transcript_245/g.838 Transcript_245/m.838 type:complete len:86 (-) Transcript_245:40-297(-)
MLCSMRKATLERTRATTACDSLAVGEHSSTMVVVPSASSLELHAQVIAAKSQGSEIQQAAAKLGGVYTQVRVGSPQTLVPGRRAA